MDNEEKTPQVLGNLLFPKIFQTFRMAVQPTKLIIAFSALAIICLAGWIMDFSRTVVATRNGNTELQIYMETPGRIQPFIERNKETGERRGVFSTLWHFAASRFNNAVNSLFAFDIPGVVTNTAGYFKALRWALRYHLLYCIIFFVIGLAVISIAGGSLCRIAALQFAQGEKPGLTEALRFGIKSFKSFFTAPLVPLGIIVAIGLCIFLLGLIGNIPRVGELIMGISMPLALSAGALIAFFLIGTIAGFNLMFPAIAYDDSDCLDAMNRAFSYIYKEPWWMGFYTLVAVVYGAICYMFIRFFAFLLLLGTRLFLWFGVRVENSNQVNKLTAIWPEPNFMNLRGSADLATTNWSESIAAFLIYLFLSVVVGLVVSFIISFYFSANTVIYSLMRNKVDNTALEDIYTPSDEVKTEPVSEEPQEQPESQTQPDSSDSAE